MSKSIHQNQVYFVYCDTELYSSETRVLGVYMSIEEAIARVKEQHGVGEMQNGFYGSFWRNETAGLRFYLRSFALGDQRKNIMHRGNVVTIS